MRSSLPTHGFKPSRAESPSRFIGLRERGAIFLCAVLTALVLSVALVAAQDHQHVVPPQAPELSTHERPVIHAVRVEKAPRIDGVWDEQEWANIPAVDTFTQQEPRIGEAATERTEVRVAYDGGHLYLSVHAYDSHPEEIVASEMRRDSDRLLDEDN